ncbi:MAG: alanine--tRNA ligase [Nitrososphaeraceae archaeon]|nr:alanine--tRNA ligase [Nitrososphaeraceae archaeon]
MGKQEISTLFSSNPDKYYRVALFDKLGFQRHKCITCGKFFWSILDKSVCPDHERYNFIGNPPTKKRLDYVTAWKEVENHFRTEDHSIIRRYPVVCRWREDLYFTIASIVDFQRIIGDKVIFELPSNPLVVPQVCLRFNDIENVGISGRHYTSFCMIGQTCNADIQGGYWKDRCIDLDFKLLTNVLGINQSEITFVEDVWMGAGAFGYSLEYFVRGLELGNAVFTEFEGDANQYRVMKNKIIDMGAGLERLAWITMGTPTSYDSCFESVIKYMENSIGLEKNKEFLSTYFTLMSDKFNYLNGYQSDNVNILKCEIAKEMHLSFEKLEKIVSPYEAIYTIADHSRTLLFAISDGSLPSNVGGGYNLRILLRRMLAIIERNKWNIKIDNLIDLHISYLKNMYPELEQYRNEVLEIMKIESDRYINARNRMNGIANNLKKTQKHLTVDDLIKLYDSDGITPDFLKELDIISDIPHNFYAKLAELHESAQKQSNNSLFDIDEELPPTRLLFYEDPFLRSFSAKVLKIINNKYVVLDESAFYPRGGGQEPDNGTIDIFSVSDVIKYKNIVLHKVENLSSLIKEGSIVNCIVNSNRRDSITKHHTATHILNSAARNTLGSWVWQNSAFKDVDYGRLDITHHSALTKEQVSDIENIANNIVMKNLDVNIKEYERGESEQKFSFRIYQGGVVPSNNVRIVNISDFDIEACGGTHVSKTGELGLIKILKSERIQDGVIRLEFVAGKHAIDFVNKQDHHISLITNTLGSSKERIVESFTRYFDESEKLRTKIKIFMRKTAIILAQYVCSNAKQISSDGVKVYSTFDNELDEDYHILIGEKSIVLDPLLLYISFISKGDGVRVIIFVGEEARKYGYNAGQIAKDLSGRLGGSGGGDKRFGQGGGKFKNKIDEVLVGENYINNTILGRKNQDGLQ